MHNEKVLSRRAILEKLKLEDLVKFLGVEVFGGSKTRSFSHEDKNPSLKLNMKDDDLKNTFKDFSDGTFGNVIKYYQLFMKYKYGKELSKLELRKDLSKIIEEVKNKNRSKHKTKFNLGVQSNQIFKYKSENDLFIQYKTKLYNTGKCSEEKEIELAKKIVLNKRKFKNESVYKDLLKFCEKADLNTDSFKYLTGNERNLSSKEIKKFNLHYVSNPQKVSNKLLSKYSSEQLEICGLFRDNHFIFNDKYIVIPFYENGHITYLRGRTINEKKYRSLYDNVENNFQERLFNSSILKTHKKDKPLYVVESEFDGMVLSRMRENMVSLSGLGTIPFKKLEQLQIQGYKLIFAFDNDEGGQGLMAVKKVANYFGKSIPYLQLEGCKDITELYGKCKKEIGKNKYVPLKEMFPDIDSIHKAFDPFDTLTGEELQKIKFPKVCWRIDQFLKPGLTLVTGRPKDGKSRLILYMVTCLANGTPFLGKYPTKKTKIYCTSYEEQFDLFQERLTKLLGTEKFPANIEFPKVYRPDSKGELKPYLYFPRLDEGGIEIMRDIFDKRPDIDVFVLDTLAKAFASKKKSNDFIEDTQTLAQLQELASEKGKCLIVIHHTRKQEAQNPIDTILGNTAYSAVPDTLMVMKKIDETKKVLSITGRRIESRSIELEVDNNTGKWVETGNGLEHTLTPEQNSVFRIFKRNPNLKFRTKNVAIIVKKSVYNVSKMLKALVRKGLIKKYNEFGKYCIVNN